MEKFLQWLEGFSNKRADVSENLRVILDEKWLPMAKSFNPNLLFEKISKSPDVLRLIFEVLHLKNIYRKWWILTWRDIQLGKCESVADHCFGVAVVSLFVANEYFPDLDIKKIVFMSLLHELGEIYAWDITPSDNITHIDKHQREKDWVERVLKWFSKYQEYYDLWLEYETQQTPESQFVKKMDKFEMMIQSAIYAWTYWKPQLIEFIERNFDLLTDLQIKNLVMCLIPLYEN